MNKMELAANGLWRLLKFLSPALFVVAIFYVIGIKRVYSHAEKTVNDIRETVQIFSTAFPNGNYRGVNTDAVVLGGNLPLEIRSKFVDANYKINNRFGGRIYFYEALGDTVERDDYFTYGSDVQLYQRMTSKNSAFIISLTNLKKRECKYFATLDWKMYIPSFMGLEAAVLTPENMTSGVYNLNTMVLRDNEGEAPFATKDIGTISRTHLDSKQADEACNCFWKNCIISLKFK